jgi:hypothetical protein
MSNQLYKNLIGRCCTVSDSTSGRESMEIAVRIIKHNVIIRQIKGKLARKRAIDQRH